MHQRQMLEQQQARQSRARLAQSSQRSFSRRSGQSLFRSPPMSVHRSASQREAVHGAQPDPSRQPPSRRSIAMGRTCTHHEGGGCKCSGFRPEVAGGAVCVACGHCVLYHDGPPAKPRDDAALRPCAQSAGPPGQEVSDASSDAVDAQAERTCAVCLEDMVHAVVRLPCRHSFHTSCIKQWLQRTAACPLCKHPCNLTENI